MAGKHLAQRYVLKINTSRLRRANWNLNITIKEARASKELIALSESQCMRWIDELNEVENQENRIDALRNRIKKLKHEENLSISRPRIRRAYKELEQLLYKKDYCCVVIDKTKDFDYIYKHGFVINGIKFKRLLGTAGGLKKNTVVFVNKILWPELDKRINNGRNIKKKMNPSKFEAYKALVCSSSTPVSMPNGIIVVKDCFTEFKSDIVRLDDTVADEPVIEIVKDAPCRLDENDGYGLAMPSLMERWGNDLDLNYLLPACVIRNSFCKGAVFPIDFQRFASENGFDTIVDIWGHEHSIDDVELILTESMLKLWDSYSSIDEYLQNCEKNHYTFCITKASEYEMENERNMNYQFLQSYNFTDEQLDELLEPTIAEINDITSEDYAKMVLYTKGIGLNEHSVSNLNNDCFTALMIEPRLKDDPYIRSTIQTMINKRINEAKVGVIRVRGNYAFVSGDPYSLCQSMFGLEVTGLLKAGEVYSHYWGEKGADKIVCYRAPMTSHNNIKLMNVKYTKKMQEFYKYMTTPIIFNSWDSSCDAMNGMDKDGDCVITTDNKILVENTKKLPAIVCVQKSATKQVVTDDDLFASNKKSFGNEVGEITNKVTAMFEIMERFPKDSKERDVLAYRILCGQLYQQNAIDSIKGIVCKSMPDEWYSWIANKIDEEKDDANIIAKKEFNRRILSDKKPYFMRYIYPAANKKYKEYIKTNNEKALMRFRKTVDELFEADSLTDEEQDFLDYYNLHLPLGIAPCIINRICYKIENLFDNKITLNTNDDDFDFSILKSGTHYSKQLYNKINDIYKSYVRELQRFKYYSSVERIDSEKSMVERYLLREEFLQRCYMQCPNEKMLCDITIDICYRKSKASKQFCWDMCGEIIVKNLLEKNNFEFDYPSADINGDIEFKGMNFSMKHAIIQNNEDYEDDYLE